MKTTVLFASLIAAASVPMASAAVVLAVDFGATGSPVQPGFEGFFVPNAESGAQQAVFGSHVVDVLRGTQGHNPTGVAGRDRSNPLDAGAFTYGSIYRDLITRFESGVGSPLTSFTVDGMDPDTQYEIQIFSLDYPNNNGSVSTWYDMSDVGTPVLIGSITNVTNTIPTSNDQFSTTGLVLSDASGLISIGSTFSAGAGQLNGFIIRTIPEPGVAALALGAVTLRLRRRRA